MQWIRVSSAAPAEAPIAARIRIRAGTGFGGGVGGGGGNRKRSRRWLLVSYGDGGDSKKLFQPKMVSWELLFGTVGGLFRWCA